jgi:hypothetical protein
MKLSIALAASALLAVLTGCATTHDNVADASYRLNRSADAFYDEVRHADRGTDVQRQARQLADAASDFRHEVRAHRSRDELRQRFDKVAKEYHDLRDEVGDHTGSANHTAFDNITAAYLDLERDLEYRHVGSL